MRALENLIGDYSGCILVLSRFFQEINREDAKHAKGTRSNF